MSTPPNDDHQLRRMLDDAVSDVHPSGGTDEIRSRAGTPRPSATRWVPITLAAAMATVLVIGGAAWLGRQSDDPTAADAPAAPAPTSQTSATDSSPEPDPGRTLEVPVYYVGQTASGPRLFLENHTVENAVGTPLQVAVQEALTGTPLDADLTAFASTDGVKALTSANDQAIVVNLLGLTGGGDDAERAVALQGLVWTADAATGTELPVVFQIDGNPPGAALPLDTTVPVQRDSADSVLAPVSIASPAEGATVSTQFEVSGMASAYEANVVWELKQGDRFVRNGFATATECCTLSPYTFTVTTTPGDYTLVVHDTDESDGEGVGINQDTKNITVE